MLVGTTLYAANLSEGLLVLDVSDPTTPILVQNHDAELPEAASLAVHEDTLFVVDPSVGIGIFDITNPAQPLLLSTHSDEDVTFNHIEIVEGFAYVSSEEKGLMVFDIQNLYDLDELQDTVTPGSLGQVQGTMPFYFAPDGPIWLHVMQTGCSEEDE